MPHGETNPKVNTKKELYRLVKQAWVVFIEKSFNPNPAYTGKAYVIIAGKRVPVIVKNGMVKEVLG